MSSAATKRALALRYIDIGVNFTDPVFRGRHRGSQKHPDDFDDMMKRSAAAGVKTMIITGGSLKESREALKLAEETGLYATAGCHPTRSKEFETYRGGPEQYLQALDKLISEHLTGKGRVVAIGECGLDYDRLNRAPISTQKPHFRSQLALAKKYNLPLFLHSRAAHSDLVSILREEGFGVNGGRGAGARGGVVHSFTGKKEEMEELIEMGFHISINGCGLKSQENLEVTKAIPLDKLMLETDAPWCTLTSTHASRQHISTLPPVLNNLYFPPSCKPERFVPGQMVKGRNEPCAIGGVAWVIAQLKGVPLEDVVEAAWKNTVQVFGLDDMVQLEREPAPSKQEFDAKKEEWPSL
ncbi:hypothetical protein BOTBODRAFT_66043 [Botryobasidium botryosum FD-172 SS1]|uniref:Uncharacterized protein n=1 Tax=Botryobasidium botryosum (strain FD-172 SS1) TaxID=930990 RepID=A0A067MIA3_BOTB1|nr:hypothetical protein BOTBODRAFT_66043 [Botryobasidium botryosum FD-172 SS1]